MSNCPSVKNATNSGKKIFAIIDEKSEIDTRDPKGEKEIKKGEIEF